MAATANQAAELKQQGALEAARDPNSSVTAEQAERKIVEEAKKSGAAVLHIDPNATPAEKAAPAVPAIVVPERIPKAAHLATDLDDGAPSQHEPPTPSSPGAPPLKHRKALFNGGIHGPEHEGWDSVGWEPRFGFPPGDFDSSESLQDRQTWLETRLGDRFYGDWWHNAGIIVFACLSCWTIAVLGGGLGYVFIVMAFCSTYYRTSIRRVRRNYRDDVNRELAKARLETDTESLEWINSFLVKFWPIYAPVLCTTIKQSVDQVLSNTTPAFLDSMRMKVFTLGTKPPRLEHVKTYPKSEDDIVLMDWKFSFNPNDTSDMTARQIKVKLNPKVVLEIRVGKGIVSKGLDVIVEDFACSGLMRVKIKLQLPFPHIERAELSFIGRPTIDYVCKPIGGELFGLDTNFIPGLSHFIMEQIHANLGPMMYDPNVFPIEVAKMLAGTPVDRAIGALQIAIHGAQGLTLPSGGTPDPYAVVTINSREELYKTKVFKEDRNPRWNETTNIIITSLTDTVDILVYDCNEFRKDVQIGRATFALEQLEHQDEYENQQLEVIYNGKPRGLIQADLRYFPVLGPTKLEDGTVLPAPELPTGIARFTVEQAKDLDGTKSLIGGLNPYAVLELNGNEVQVSRKLKHTNNPIWPDAYKELLISNRKTAKLRLVIKDDREISAEPILGTYKIKLDDLLELTKKGREWFPLSGAKTGRAKMTLEWKPVAMRGALTGSDGYVTPIGVMRLHFQNARDLKNVETVGKSDPYVRVLLSGITKGRTVTWRNDLNPDWDEVVYVPVHSSRELITCEVMDEESGINRDRLLGHFSIDLREYVRQDRDTGEYEQHDDKKVINQPLSTGPGRPTKGIVHYTCSFFPSIPVVDPEEEEREEETAREAAAAAKEASVNGDVAGKLTTNSKRSSSEIPRKSAEYLSPTTTQAKSNFASSGRTPSPNASTTDLANTLAESDRGSILGGKEVPKIRLDKENLMDYGMRFKRRDKSGLLIFKLVEGDFPSQSCHLEIHVDDNAYPAYSTKIKSKHQTLGDTGEAMIRELDQSKLSIRLVEHTEKEGKTDKDQSIAHLAGPSLLTLQNCLYHPTQLTLYGKDGHGVAKITASLKYVPVKMTLDPSERADNSGKLHVDVMDAADLPAADRNGFSDPYCKFILNGKEVYKSDKQRKTLHPAWNESFETAIRSRIAAKFVLEVWDWDFGDKSDFLGKTDIDLGTLQPFTKQEVKLALDGQSGVVRLRLLFTPQYVTRQHQGTSTFQGTFAVPGKIVGAPVKGLGKGAQLVGGGVSKTATFLGKGFRRNKNGMKDSLEDIQGDDASDINRSQTSIPAVAPDPTSTAAAATTTTAAAAAAAAAAATAPRDTTPAITVGGNHTDGTSPSPSPLAPSPLTPSPHSRTKSWSGQSRPDSMYGASLSGSTEIGTATIAVLSASGFPPSAHVRVQITMATSKGGTKEIHKTRAIKPTGTEIHYADGAEVARVHCAPDTPFRIVVQDHHTFGADQDLGEGQFFVADQGGGGEHVVKVGSGSVKVRSAFALADAASTAGTPGRGSGTLKSRFGRRGDKERSVTPSGLSPGL